MRLPDELVAVAGSERDGISVRILLGIPDLAVERGVVCIQLVRAEWLAVTAVSSGECITP